MRYLASNSLSGRVSAALTRLRNSTDGVAAVEFALIVPIMAALLIGTIELSQAITVDRRVTQVATTTGDLVARADGTIYEIEKASKADSVTNNILDVMRVGSWLLAPYNAASLNVTISVVTSNIDNENIRRTKWRCTFDGANPNAVTCTCPNTIVTIPNGLVGRGDSVVVAEVEYGYRPMLFDHFLKNSMSSSGGVYTISERVYLKPRAACPRLEQADDTICGCS